MMNPLLPMGQAPFGAHDNPVHAEPQTPDRDETDKNRRQIVVKLRLVPAKAKAGLPSNELSRNNGRPGRRSEHRREGTGSGSTCRSWSSPSPSNRPPGQTQLP